MTVSKTVDGGSIPSALARKKEIMTEENVVREILRETIWTAAEKALACSKGASRLAEIDHRIYSFRADEIRERWQRARDAERVSRDEESIRILSNMATAAERNARIADEYLQYMRDEIEYDAKNEQE